MARARLRAQAAAAGLTAESSPLDFLRATGYDVDGMASALRDANGDPAAFCRAMMGNESMQQMMLGATRRSGSLEAALSLEQRDETWLVIISESGQGPEFLRKTTVFNVEGDDLGEILSSVMGDWRTQGDTGRTDDILAALVKACCYPAQFFGNESGATPTASPMGHEPCRPARVLLDQELFFLGQIQPLSGFLLHRFSQ